MKRGKCYFAKAHSLAVADDQSDTGTAGVRMRCAECFYLITIFDPKLHKKLHATPPQDNQAE